MGKRILYKCEKCGKAGAYESRNQKPPKYPKTKCPFCEETTAVRPNLPPLSTSNLQKKRQSRKKSTTKTQKSYQKRDQRTSEQRENSAESQNSKNFGTLDENDPWSTTSISTGDFNRSSVDSKSFRNHSYRWKILVKKFPPSYLWDENRTVKMSGGWEKKFKIERDVIVEGHFGTKKSLLILNINKDLYTEIPDPGIMTLQFAKKYCAHLVGKYNFEFRSGLFQVQPHHSAANVSDEPVFDGIGYIEVENELGALSIDHSKDKNGVRHTEFEMRNKKPYPYSGKQLIQRMIQLPYEMDIVRETFKHIASTIITLQKEISDLAGTKFEETGKTKPKPKPEAENYDHLYI